MSAAAVKRQLRAILSGSILGVTLKGKGEVNRSNLVTLLAQNEAVVNGMKALWEQVAESCPQELNAYGKHDPCLGDLWHVVHNWKDCDGVKRGAVQAFLEVLFNTKVWKLLTKSGAKNEVTIRKKFNLPLPEAFSEKKPMRGGESYIGQPTPSDTKNRHITEKGGDAVVPNNLSPEQGKGELMPSSHPDALMSNQSLPQVISIQDAMTDIATAQPDSSLNYKTKNQPRSVQKDTKLMAKQPTTKASGYSNTKGLGKVQTLNSMMKPMHITPPYTQSKDQMMISAANSDRSTRIPGGEVSRPGQAQLNITAFQTGGQGTGGKTTMGGVPDTDVLAHRKQNFLTPIGGGSTEIEQTNKYAQKRISDFRQAYGDLASREYKPIEPPLAFGKRMLPLDSRAGTPAPDLEPDPFAELIPKFTSTLETGSKMQWAEGIKHMLFGVVEVFPGLVKTVFKKLGHLIQDVGADVKKLLNDIISDIVDTTTGTATEAVQKFVDTLEEKAPEKGPEIQSSLAAYLKEAGKTSFIEAPPGEEGGKSHGSGFKTPDKKSKPPSSSAYSPSLAQRQFIAKTFGIKIGDLPETDEDFPSESKEFSTALYKTLYNISKLNPGAELTASDLNSIRSYLHFGWQAGPEQYATREGHLLNKYRRKYTGAKGTMTRKTETRTDIAQQERKRARQAKIAAATEKSYESKLKAKGFVLAGTTLEKRQLEHLGRMIRRRKATLAQLAKEKADTIMKTKQQDWLKEGGEFDQVVAIIQNYMNNREAGKHTVEGDRLVSELIDEMDSKLEAFVSNKIEDRGTIEFFHPDFLPAEKKKDKKATVRGSAIPALREALQTESITASSKPTIQLNKRESAQQTLNERLAPSYTADQILGEIVEFEKELNAEEPEGALTPIKAPDVGLVRFNPKSPIVAINLALPNPESGADVEDEDVTMSVKEEEALKAMEQEEADTLKQDRIKAFNEYYEMSEHEYEKFEKKVAKGKKQLKDISSEINYIGEQEREEASTLNNKRKELHVLGLQLDEQHRKDREDEMKEPSAETKRISDEYVEMENEVNAMFREYSERHNERENRNKELFKERDTLKKDVYKDEKYFNETSDRLTTMHTIKSRNDEEIIIEFMKQVEQTHFQKEEERKRGEDILAGGPEERAGALRAEELKNIEHGNIAARANAIGDTIKPFQEGIPQFGDEKTQPIFQNWVNSQQEQVLPAQNKIGGAGGLIPQQNYNPFGQPINTNMSYPVPTPQQNFNPFDSHNMSARLGADPNAGASNVYTPELRLFMREGDANEVVRVNEDPDAKQINRLGWQSFNNYSWEANEEVDNPLHMLNIIDETRRFYEPLDKEELIEKQAEDAITECFDNTKECFEPPEDVIMDGDSLILDTRGDGNLTLLSPDETENVFHDVYMKPWIEISESSPWKQFTQVQGSQLPDSQLQNTCNYGAADNSLLRFENAFIFSTPA